MHPASVFQKRTYDRLADRRVLQRLGRATRAVCDRRLAKPDSNRVQALQVGIRQIGITLPDVVNRLIHPVALVVFSSLEHSAAVYMAEQLVTRSIQKLLVGQVVLLRVSMLARLQRAGSWS